MQSLKRKKKQEPPLTRSGCGNRGCGHPVRDNPRPQSQYKETNHSCIGGGSCSGALVKKLEKKILKEIKPKSEERKRFKVITTSFLKKLNVKLKGAKAVLGGSGAKGTWLSGNHDVDIFVMFNYNKYKDKSSQLSKLLEPALKKAFPHQRITRLHGSRDYFQLRYESLDFEVVPILKTRKAEQAVNITDVSPLHAYWIKKNAKGQKIKNEILLTKQFFKANKLYGAESYIAGFSGYVLEILIVYYDSFEKLLKAALRWRNKDRKKIIDIAKHYKGKNALFELNKSKTNSPLIVIDPVDKSRNAAAALSIEKVNLLKKAARSYLKKPTREFFEKKEIDNENLKQLVKKKKLNLLFLTIHTKHGKEDVVGSKLLKAFSFLQKKLHVFDIVKSGWDWDKHHQAIFYFICKENELPEFETRKGPPAKLKEAAAKFRKTHPNSYIKDGRIVAKVKIEHRTLRAFLYKLIKDDYFNERVKQVRRVEIV